MTAPARAAERAHRHPWLRLAAWAIDWCLILAWAAVLAAIAVPLYLAGALQALPIVWANVVSAALLVVPVTLVLAGLESSRRAATIGKRALRLRVIGIGDDRLGYLRAVGRNALKIALPWLVGHAAAYAIVATSSQTPTPAWVWVLTAVAYLLPIVWIAALFIGSGRTPYDRAAGTVVSRLTR